MPFLLFALAIAAPIRAQAARSIGPFEDEMVAAPVPDDEDEGDEADDGEEEVAEPGVTGPEIKYSADLPDDELERRWKDDLQSLGSISVGFADQGRLINAARMPLDDAWILERPSLAYGTKEAVDALINAFHAVRKQFPSSAPARLSHIGNQDGGYLRPHHSHQSGRDADIGFFYRNDRVPGRGVRRDRLMDPARNWALIRTLITGSDVQVILVDKGIQKVLRDWALANGEDRDFIDRVFAKGHHALIQHARHHKDHFHVRFYAPRSQELGRRVQPLLAQRPEQNLVMHKVRQGQTLGHIARAYDTTIKAIQIANHMRGSFLHLGQQLRIPLRKPCTHCPLPPPVVVPPRCLPASAVASASSQ
ncbi:MAG: penicillin-insensitive murein endopeptidase [Myxococcales bacterium]|nr:penicillin-insensitive murein endopeptidase [Myxococcales bacterium]